MKWELTMRLFLSVFFIYFVSAITVKKPHLDAHWYAQTQDALELELEQLNKQAQHFFKAHLDAMQIKAIIVPHAGYSYSGAVAASVYRLLNKKQIKKVIIIAPDHHVSFEGVGLPAFDAFQTPLGTLSINTRVVHQLEKQSFFKKTKAFEHEHSIEVQLPMIQHFLAPDIMVLPLLVGTLTCEQAVQVAQVLKTLIDDKTVVIISSDFIHYGKQYRFTPFKDHFFYRIRALDSQAVELISQGTCEQFADFEKKTHATICGFYPFLIFLALKELNSFGSIEPRLIAYARSDIQRTQKENTVSYVGMLFTQEKLAPLPIEYQLTQQEQRGLFQESQDILTHLFDKKIGEELFYPIKSWGVQQAHGAFVTLKKNNELRGCIGRVSTTEPLYKTIADLTRESALHDTRFLPVTKAEIPTLNLSLSILSPTHLVKTYKDIIVGKDGIIVQNNNQSALFLPEVPLEFHWNLEQTLTQLSQKAGLKGDAWLDKNTKFLTFSTLDITSITQDLVGKV